MGSDFFFVFQDKGVLLTTYDIVRNNVKSLCGDYYRYGDGSDDEIIWDYMILDEVDPNLDVFISISIC